MKDQQESDAYEIQSIMSIIDDIESQSPPTEKKNNILPGVIVSKPEDFVSDAEEANKAIDQFNSLYKAQLERYGDKSGANLEEVFKDLVPLALDPLEYEKAKINLSSMIDIITLDGIRSMMLALYIAIKKMSNPVFAASLNPVDAAGYIDRLMNQLERLKKMKSLLKVKDPEIEMRQILHKQQNGAIEGPKDPGSRARILQIMKQLEEDEN